nr:SDR family oxidoreductase [Clostridium sp. 19966]
MNLSGKVAIVTGASRGIGKAIALELSSKGASVIINYSKDKDGAEETLNEILKSGGYAIAKAWNVGNYESCIEAINYITEKFGKIDILVNNAGISKIGLFMDMNKNEWDEIININLKGIINMCNLVINPMLKSGEGNIVNISSIWGVSGASCEVIYSTTKGAINAFTKALSKELAMSKIRVNAVAPGVIDTAMNRWMSSDEEKELIDEIPLGRFGKADEVAKAVSFLCSGDSSYITGQILTVDGGFL